MGFGRWPDSSLHCVEFILEQNEGLRMTYYHTFKQKANKRIMVIAAIKSASLSYLETLRKRLEISHTSTENPDFVHSDRGS